MDERRTYLKALLDGEARAYGFTIAFWGAGAMLINAHGVPGVERALLYGLGAVTGFGVLALAAFGKTSEEVDSIEEIYLVLGMVHYLSALLPIYLAHLIVSSPFSPEVEFFLCGVTISTVYNLLAVLEEDIVEVMIGLSP